VHTRPFTIALTVIALASCLAANAEPPMICNHRAVYDKNGVLRPWTTWRDAITREMRWYAACPLENGYPRFAVLTFMEGDYSATTRRPSFIPATQDGMGIISYLKYWRFTGRKNEQALRYARLMGDYLVKEASTPDTGKYPRFTRSTGWASKFPQPPDCGSQDDRAYEIEPDKGGIAGHALVELYRATKDRRYLDQALQNARDLAANIGPGDATRSPWPFRADYRTGEPRGLVSGNMAFILRLLDDLLAEGYPEFKTPREALWQWITQYQIPNAARDGMLWAQFFEDHASPENRTAWAPLSLARYLVERKDDLDPDWRKDARILIDFVNRTFTDVWGGVLTCFEQDQDIHPWGGVNSTWGAVLAMYSKATGADEFKGLAWQALNYCLYATNDDGCPRDGAWREEPGRGGWQEDAHTDKIHNYMDAVAAYPEWWTAK
jgi:hypothetical protein